MVQIKVVNNSAVEGSQYMLMCYVVGPADHIHWMLNGQPLQGDNTNVFVMNSTVLFNPLEQNDTGSYQCMAMNSAGSMTSPPYMLLVNCEAIYLNPNALEKSSSPNLCGFVTDGPETPVIEGTQLAETGQPASFNCSVMSVPPSQISWWFNDTLVANMSMFTISQLSLNMSGEYACMAYNNVTGMNSSSSIMLTVVGKKLQLH